jgi:hypothetical protein
MQYIELTKGYVAAVDSIDYERVSEHKWYAKVRTRIDGTFAVYAIRAVCKEGGGNTTQGMHRFILNTPSGMETDHINGNGLDNRRTNLRVCTCSENQRNQRPQEGKSSKFKGVTWGKRKGMWRAQINSSLGYRDLGYFSEETAAAQAYDTEAVRIYGEFARPNHISEIGA